MNPGGPGVAGIELLSHVSAQMPDAIRDRFDIVTWDPRGTGASSPVDCGRKLDYLFVPDTAPDDPAELAELESAHRRFARACERRSGELLGHISTSDTVDDLDALRSAVGDSKLTFLGFSYGTYLGGMYAARYPERVGTMVLDGAVDPSLDAASVTIEQAQGFDASLRAFFAWCAAGGDRCRFAEDLDPATAYDRLQRAVDDAPVGDGVDRFGPTQLEIGVSALLYGGELGYRTLATGLRELQQGSAAGLRAAYDEYLERRDGVYQSTWPAFIAISCLDGPTLTVAEMEALQQRAATAAPEFGAGNVGLGYACSYWPVPPLRSGPIEFEAATAPPILVIGTTGDPATPLAWARSLAEQLGSGRLLVVDGSTHTASLGGNECVDGYLEDALIRSQVPVSGTRCG